MPTFAAVDIGSNSVRLKIARVRGHRLTVIHEDREVTRLGEKVFQKGHLLPETMAHTIKVLRRFHRNTQRQGVTTVRVVATSALRDASNQEEFLNWVRAATGWNVEIISGLEEGRLIHLGLVSDRQVGTAPHLLVDLGGGSCELTVTERGHIQHMVSLPLGAVRLTQEFLQHDPARRKEVTRLREYVREELQKSASYIRQRGVRRMLATSGSAAALASLAQKRGELGDTATRLRVHGLTERLSGMSLRERAALAGLGPRRAEIIVAGAVVFSELMEACELPSFRYSPLGLRDGLLAQMAAEFDSQTGAGQMVASDRRDAVRGMCERYGVELAHAECVQRLAQELFRALKPLHQLPPDYQDWLSAAAMLHEVGAYVNRSGRHRHAYYIVAHSELFGYSVAQRRLIAAIVRYQGRTRPAQVDRIVRALPAAERRRLPAAVLLLRLAKALNQSRNALVRSVGVRRRDGKLILRLGLRQRSGAELELWALEKERDYFRSFFGEELEAVVS